MATKSVDLHDAQSNLKELLSHLADGDEIVLTDGKQPVARVLPVAVPALVRQPGLHPGAIRTSDDFDAALPEEFWAGDA